MSRPVVVVGGGLAGISAAIAAAGAGSDVTLVARAPGATALYAGAMEISPDVEHVLMNEPFHPFTRLYRDHVKLAADLAEAASELAGRLARAGLATVDRAGVYLDVHGRTRRADLVPATVAPGELGSLRGRRVGVVDVPGVTEYDAVAIVETLAEEHGVMATAVAAEVPDLPPVAALGDLFERPAPRPAGNVELLAYPPGFAGLPHNGFELLSTPPAPHGWRLQKALDKVLATAAIEVVTDEVTGFDTDGDEVRTACGTGGATWPGAAFVLATGRFIGGGLVKSRLVREPLLDLAVYYQGEPVESAYAVLSHLEYVDPAPAFRTGLLTDKELHPVGVDGRPAFRNLFAAGSILGGYDYAGGGCGFGLPLLTGRLAGRFAAG